MPFTEALGCSTSEARLMLAEGTAAVRNRRRGRQHRGLDKPDEPSTYDPKNHLKYLDPTYQAPQQSQHVPVTSHSRSPSDVSTSTVMPAPPASPAGPIGNYSANLAMFIKAQLQTIPTYTSDLDVISPRSCPDFSFELRTPPQSPRKSSRRPSDAPSAIDIPPVRPPLQSCFSAWSSTDDETEEPDNDMPSLPEAIRPHGGDARTPSIIGLYTHANRSFLLAPTPSDECGEPVTARGLQLLNDDANCLSSCSSRAHLYSSSAPSLSSASASVSASASTSSYFEFKQRPLSFAPHLKERIIAAVTPPKGRVLTAVSPFDGGALSDVHDLVIESQQRVHVDGMSFDMLRDFIAPSRVTTPC